MHDLNLFKNKKLEKKLKDFFVEKPDTYSAIIHHIPEK